MRTAYYNENDPYAAQWLRNLIAAGEIPAGDVDDRSIVDVRPEDLDGYGQCHFFAGVGGWPLALWLAGWPDDRPVWTASCPCPPFSVAGKKITCPSCKSSLLVWCPRRTGFAICADCGHAWLADTRHLWPEVWRLAAERRPERIFGEQVASATACDWLAGVRASLEILGYAVGAPDLPAACVGAPHMRQRLWWVADSGCTEPPGRNEAAQDNGRGGGTRRVKEREPAPCGAVGGLADAGNQRRQRGTGVERTGGHTAIGGETSGDAGVDGVRSGVGNASGPGLEERPSRRGDHDSKRSPVERAGGHAGGLGNPASNGRRQGCQDGSRGDQREPSDARSGPLHAGADSGVGVPDGAGSRPGQQAFEAMGHGDAAVTAGDLGGVAIPDGGHAGAEGLQRSGQHGQQPQDGGAGRMGNTALPEGARQPAQSQHVPGPANFWSAYDLIPCGDGKSRRVEPGTFPLAHGVPARVGRLRAYGNAINPWNGAEFVQAYLAAEADMRGAA